MFSASVAGLGGNDRVKEVRLEMERNKPESDAVLPQAVVTNHQGVGGLGQQSTCSPCLEARGLPVS